MQRIALTMSLGALVALVAAGPAAAVDAPVVHTVVKQVPVKQGKATESKAVCPSTMAAIAGSVVNHPSGSTLRLSLPSGVRSWRFAFRGYAGLKKGTATVLVRCVALKVPPAAGKVALNVNTVSRGIGLDPLSTTPATIDCRSGFVPTAWGFDIPAPNTAQNAAPPEEVQIFKALADSRGFTFGAENLGASSVVVKLRVRCLDQSVAGKAGLSHRWRVKRQRYSNRISSGVRTVRHSCSAGYLSIGLGQDIDAAGDSVFRRSFDVGTRSAHWVFDSGSGTAAVTTQLLCLNTRTSFR